MEAKYIERLEQVVRVLVELPQEKKFDLAWWMECDTTGCAVGWAAKDPWFAKRGLRLVQISPHRYRPGFRHYYDSDAVIAFFGLTSDEEDRLFYDEAYTRGSRYDVIRRLKVFIRKQREAA